MKNQRKKKRQKEKAILRGLFELKNMFAFEIEGQSFNYEDLYDLWFFEAKRMTI